MFKEEIEQDNANTQEDFTGGSSTQSMALNAIGLFFLEVIKIVVLAAITVGIVRYFLFKPFYVKGESMVPNFQPSDYLIIDELSYRFRPPQRGEAIVFRAPMQVQKDYYLKRVIGLPGERIQVEDNKIIVFNEEHPKGVLVKEEYIIEETPGSVSYVLGEDQYFVLGDNRDASYDSRRFGPIHKDTIVGRTWIRGWPIDTVEIFQPPQYNF
ncbi:MAG: signal peptidase I [Candidatus Magasanikbacteria bacterium]|jgi:signal peptidase I|nr:signal peptidase I [Candidatus Magasanikbacteria bacterium]MBT6294140.1 signal peptidase I [Candidatus Magasanikbacteria bacterium]